MATFTKLTDEQQPVISVNPNHKIAKIEDNTYGGFTEHMGRCIYGGLYDPGSPLSDENDYRKDVIEAFQELKCPVVRYPGGNFIATYHWQDGIGPREKRPKKQELAWHGIETNEFGTDEFLRWCEVVGTEPYLALNFGTGTLDEAMASPEHLKNATAPRSAERAIEITASLIDLARIENKIPNNIPRQKICFDEWNVWDPVRAPGWLGAEEKYTLSDALAVAVWLNVFIRQAKYIGMATIAQSVNVISPLMTTKNGLLKQPTWWPLLLFSKHMRGQTIGVNVQCGEYEGQTKPEWIRGTIETPWLDVSASINDEGIVSLVVVNIHETKSFATKLEGVSGKVDVFTVAGPSIDAVNTEEKEEVGIAESSWDGQGLYEFPQASMTMLRWKP
ncbi:hypothetical protein BN1708_003705 [Verticillium longisporum]|uniref:non-reducing end alpha-L-arabinofuranosidase n=1 Tax=Verticillium longisporum TaxID=100787 RepID=A0A0G4LQ04_VERLO|nr:hypothetical protein BN1708_003705 [Verticillium longisporum]